MSPDTPIARAQRVLELERVATSGPWAHDHVRRDGAVISLRRVVVSFKAASFNDCAFIAETRTLAPALAADVQALTEELNAARQYLISEGLRASDLGALLRDALPMFRHRPDLADRAAALGVTPPVEAEPVPSLADRIEKAKVRLSEFKAARYRARGQDSFDHIDEQVSYAPEALAELEDEAQIESAKSELAALGVTVGKEDDHG